MPPYSDETKNGDISDGDSDVIMSEESPPRRENSALGKTLRSAKKGLAADRVDESDEPEPCSSKQVSRKGVTKKSTVDHKEKSGSSSKESSKKGQPDIKSLFAAQSGKNKRKSEANCGQKANDVKNQGEAVQKEKKRKLDEHNQSSKQEPKQTDNSTNATAKKSFMIERCTECRQILDDKELRMFPGDPGEAVEEFVALTDPRLSLFTGDEAEVDEADQRPQHRLTSFSVYDRMTHLCPFDSGLLEKNKELYFSGYVKPIYDDNPDVEGGICTRNMGPINEWWTTGFDGGENPVVGFSTAFAEYILLAPSEAYEPLWEAVIDKVQLAKVVIEFLKEASEMEEAPSYEDLVNRVQITVPKRGASKIGSRLGFTEDSLLQHSQFIVDQIQSYDEAAAEDETILITQPCVRSLVKLTGVTLGRKLGPAAGFKPKRVKGKTVQAAKKDSMATVTPLVRAVFDAMFKGQIEADDKSSAASKRRRCGVCEACQLPDCGKCRSCMDMIKFGGTGRSKQACLTRKCPYMMVKEAEEDDILDDGDIPGGREAGDVGEDDNVDSEEKTGSKKRKREESGSEDADARHAVTHKLGKVSDVKIEWFGVPLEAQSANRVFYGGAVINGETILVGDHVCVRPDDPSIPHYIAQVRSMWQDVKSGQKHFHARWLNRGSDTILGEASDPRELFLVDDCQDSPLCFMAYKVKVKYIYHSRESFYADSVGSYDALVIGDETGDGKTFFCQKWYDQERARFQDFNSSDVVDAVLKENLSEANAEDNKENMEKAGEEDKTRGPAGLDPLSCCPSCDRLKEKKLYETPSLSEELSLEEVQKAGGTSDGENLFGVVSSKNKIFYNQLRYNGQDIKIGDCAYLSPDSFDFAVKQPKHQQPTSSKSSGNYEESAYTELYRKSDYIKGSNDDVPDPFRIGRIVAMYVKSSSLNFGKGSTPDVKDVNLIVQKFYRPENTHKGVKATHCSDLNLLYWSEEKAVVPLEEFAGKCEVSFFDEIDLGLNSVSVLNEYFKGGVDRFYFTEAYDAESKEMKEVPREARTLEHNRGKRKGKGKGKGKSSVEVEEKSEVQPLKCLDVFAGCGGLSEGLHQAGIATSKWAIEKDEAAAQAFRLNNPTSVVFSDDCNELLRLVMSGATASSSGQKLPRKGEVELLCGGPPCQGFSGMNRFNQREYSKFKNSLIASYLSYCDYYRPRYFLLENVRNFVSFKRSLVLKLALRCLISMGYQCTFGILQAGCYGVPQTRRRAIILAAAPGYKLPEYPEPVHSFSTRGMQLSVVVDDRKFEGCVRRLSGVAPLRTTTVRDAMYDLPPIHNGAGQSETTYSGSSLSHFQRLIRPVSGANTLLDHICKEMSPLVLARMQFIPLAPGSDWRDLPNVEVMLKDNSRSKILRYTHDDKRAGKSKDGSLRGVCSCAEGGSCDPAFRQFNTLIPWCLPHTGNRHNHWAGLYGRLEWEGFFSTTVTNPEPMGKQGRVLHPEQHRVVSVRECARSQGFPDCYRFYGSILDKHRQVGNAVPPPMARHIGLEIKKAMILSL